MQYRVQNKLTDMKLMRNGRVLLIKKGILMLCTQAEYQYLSQIYGNSVKGERLQDYRITEPVKFESNNTSKEKSTVQKKNKSKKR